MAKGKYGYVNKGEYPGASRSRFGGRRVQTPGANWDSRDARRQKIHNPPDPEEGEKEKGFVSTVARYFQRYRGAGKSEKQAASSYLRPKQVVHKRLKEALKQY